MKTKTLNQRFSFNLSVITVIVVLNLFPLSVFSQENDSTKALFKSDIRVSELWAPEVKVNSVQGDVGTLIGFYGGAVFNRTFLLGISGCVNLSHPRVNYGYFGIVGQYIYNPYELLHFSGQLVIAHGSTKDYENPKSGLLDNFWNISGAGFYVLEPGVNLEVNLSKRLTLVAGVSYRWVTGLNENNENISITHVTNRDLSGLNLNISLKFGKERKLRD